MNVDIARRHRHSCLNDYDLYLEPRSELFPLFDRVRQRHLGLNVSYICLSPKDRNCRHYEYKHSYKTLLDKSCHQQSQPATSVLQGTCVCMPCTVDAQIDNTTIGTRVKKAT